MMDNRSAADGDPTADTDVSPLLLGRYRVEAVLGTGGAGHVVKAYDVRNKRSVAIKTLKPSLVISDSAYFHRLHERFTREVEANAGLGVHSNIVTVFDQASDADGTLYLILEYLANGTLADRLRRGPLPPTEALGITADVAKGLRVAHRQDIVHRDVKPANIFLSTEGHAKIGDFGIAQLGNLSGRTYTGIAHPHTPLYASPEQEQSAAYLSPATDQYSLGLVLFEMLTGKRYKQLDSRQRAAELRAHPAPVTALVARMTAAAAEDRYPTIDAVVTAIAAIGPLADRTVTQRGQGPERDTVALVPDNGGIEPAPARPDTLLLQPVAPISADPPPRRISRRAMLTGIGGVVVAGGVTGGVLVTRWGASGGAAAATPTIGGTAARTTATMPAAGPLPSVLREHAAPVVGIAFAEQTLASAAYHEQVNLWRVRDGTRMTPLVIRALNSMALAPDGQVLAIGTTDPELRLWRVSDGASLPTRFEGHRYSIYAVAFASDGRMLASASRDPGVIVFRVSDGTALQTFAERTNLTVGTLAFSRDGQLLAFASADTVRLGRVGDGAVVQTLRGHKDAVNGVAFSPDGAMVASASGDRTAMLWRASDGAPLRTFTGPDGHLAGVSAVAFSPDGAMLATASGDTTIKLWRVSDGTVVRTLAGHTQVVSAVAFSPTGAILASGSDDMTVRIWQIP